ncbi:MAG: HAMP domain-containing histidine kinase [Chitinophagales bacterium]|nr:HAMP domain-containing histidine kinase [Chitinophagales bacterium]
MKKPIPSANNTVRHRDREILLIGLTMLVIAGFQGYWLKNSYDREKKALAQRTNIHFRETLMGLQAAAFKFQELEGDSATRLDIDFTDKAGEQLQIKVNRGQDVAGLVNALGKRVGDSLSKKHSIRSTIVFSDEKNNILISRDSTRSIEATGKGNGLLSFLYRIDSLQDTLSSQAIDSAFAATLKKEKINVPFTIVRTAGAKDKKDRMRGGPFPPFEPGMAQRMREIPDNNKVVLGFTHPMTYELVLGNTLPYLLNRLLLPILFSLFLIGVTIVSLVFLYRNLMRQRRLTAMKNDFISNVTHELKTPIATVGVAIEALKNFNAINDPARTKEYLDISQNELNRLSLLVDKVLKLSMFENKEMDLRKESFDLKQVTEEVVSSFRLQFEKFHASAEILTEGSDFTLLADRMHITSLLYNLVDNALKYSPEAPEIKVLLADKGAMVQIAVSDKGVGIPPEYRQKVFEKFFRVPAGDTHNVKGYGLGLSYAAEVVAKHGGTVEVNSETGKGTTFIINLPKQHG